ANPALTYTAGGLLSGDTLTASLTTSASPTSNVGAYAIALGSVSLSPNYSLTYTGANLSVTPRALSVVADAKTRVYGDANPALTYVQTGLVNGDTLQGALATSATSASGLGDYAITRGSLASSGNYSMSYTGAGLSVTPRALTITADSQSKIFGSVFAFTGREFKTQGLVNGDRVDAVRLSSLGAPATAAVGSDGSPKTYAIDIVDPTGVGLGKYAVTLVGSLLTVQMLTTVEWASTVTPVSQVSAASSMPFGGPSATVIEWDKSLEPAQDWMPLRLRRLDDEGQGQR
ncbi:MAG: hypothetical protein JWL93_296, partial [Hyphomicrobiales bacterium]|nr:hypothetical protein [Hyphomicrobiales bacterium]